VDVFIRLRRFYQPYIKFLIVSVSMLILTVALGLVYPYLLRLIVNRVIVGHEYQRLPMLLAAIVAAAVVKGLFNFGQQVMGQKFGIRTGYDVRNALYEKLNKQSFQYYDRVHTGDLMSRLTGDMEAFRQFLSWGFNSIVNFVLLTGFGLAMMFSMNWKLTLVVVGLMPCLAVVAIRFDGKLWPAYRDVRKKVGQLNTAVQENIMGVRTVKSFARESYEIDKFGGRNHAYFSAQLNAVGLWKKFFPYMELLGNIGVVLLLFAGGYFVIHGQMTLGDLVAFFSVLWYIIQPMSQLGYLLNNWTQSVAAGERLLEILDADMPVKSPEQGHRAKARGHVVFENVSLSYDGMPALHNIRFEAKPGQTIAFLGVTGSGKSSILNLIPRFYDVTSGRVLLDGVDVRNWDLNALRRNVAVVFQESFLFSTSIFANICYGKPDATPEEVERAARLAKAAEFIEDLPDGYATLVGERGIGLSGGQKQRIALARAILQDPTVLILDDATSAVDMETEYEIQQALEEVMKGKTTFIIAHRISSLKRADQVLVIDKGRVVQRGTHDELLQQEGLYRTIYDMQFRDKDEIRLGAVESAR
jgi:ATP-binding cassette, subfamily B, multidrug efflux pump